MIGRALGHGEATAESRRRLCGALARWGRLCVECGDCRPELRLERRERSIGCSEAILDRTEPVVDVGVNLRDRAGNGRQLSIELLLEIVGVALDHVLDLVQDALAERMVGLRIRLELLNLRVEGLMLAGTSACSARAAPGCERERRRGTAGEGVDVPELMKSTRGATVVGAMAASVGNTPL